MYIYTHTLGTYTQTYCALETGILRLCREFAYTCIHVCNIYIYIYTHTHLIHIHRLTVLSRQAYCVSVWNLNCLVQLMTVHTCQGGACLYWALVGVMLARFQACAEPMYVCMYVRITYIYIYIYIQKRACIHA